jgi:hypothetical protein
MKNICLIILFSALAAGCNMPNKKPGDGRQWMEISCNGFADWTKCYEKAKNLCPGGYDIANQQESLIEQQRTMEVACDKEINRSGELLPEEK